jgi:alkylhydroperoxidase family enzyme
MAIDAGLLNEQECLDARKGIGPDDKTTKMLEFTKKVKITNGKVSNDDLQTVRDAGYKDQDIIEMIGSICLINFANLVSNVAEPELDFPELSLKLG